jgi:cobalt/nickel transport system permease protein
MWALVIPAWYWAGHRVKSTLSSRQAPLVAIGAAFTFVIMMFNIPLPGGTTGHAVGGTIITIIIGPWAAVIAISVAIVIQAVFFGDGGILAIGANCFNIGFILPITGYFTYKLLARGAAPKSPRRWVAAGIGAWVGLNAAAFLTSVEFGLQGELFNAADGSALYSPYGLATAIPAMMIPHLLIVGAIEAVMTSMIYVFLMKTNASLLENYAGVKAAAAGGFKLKPLIVGILLLLVCTPLGLLATGTAWGEWGTKDISREIGYVPEGMASLAGRWQGLLPDYAFPESEEVAAAGMGGASGEESGGSLVAEENAAESRDPVSFDGMRESTPAYVVSGILGLILVTGVALMAMRMLTGRSRGKEHLG